MTLVSLNLKVPVELMGEIRRRAALEGFVSPRPQHRIVIDNHYKKWVLQVIERACGMKGVAEAVEKELKPLKTLGPQHCGMEMMDWGEIWKCNLCGSEKAK